MKSHIFPLNLLKLQRPPVLRLRTRIDGAFIVSPFDPEVAGSTETNGVCTNTDSGTGGNTSTNVETGTYADMSTHTATAFVTRGDEKQIETVVDEKGNPVKDVSKVRISEVRFEELGAAEGDVATKPTNPISGRGQDRLFTVNDPDEGVGYTDNGEDRDNLDDTDDDGDYPSDVDEVRPEGVLLPFDSGLFQPPLAPQGTRAKRR
jgi:hypothetical protein